MSEYNMGGSSALPSQKVTESQRTKEWKEASLNYYCNFRFTNGSNLRSVRADKIINYDLANGRINLNNIRKICDPMEESGTFGDTFIHHDKISPILHELLGEESIKPDNALVYSEAQKDITRKASNLKGKIVDALNRALLATIDPSTIDPNNPPPTPEQILKIERSTPSDLLEGKSNKLLKILKKKLNTKLLLNQGFKDALIAGEEIYWTGILNGDPALRKCNPLNMTIILDDNDMFIDDAIAVIEERSLTIPSILDEYGDELTKQDLDKLQIYSNGVFGTFNATGSFTPVFETLNGKDYLGGVTPNGSVTNNNSSNFSLRVVRVEWIGMKLVGTLKYTDIESGEIIQKVVDESFKKVWTDFKVYYPDAEIDWFWKNDAWEGVKIGADIYLGIRSKPNQRVRMDNPYYTKLGYTGFIYEATNSKSVSLVDRLKSYQYLYDIISWKLQIVFGSDMGKLMLMDMAQIPRSEGVSLEQWMYYLKENKIAFINSFEESNKGTKQGQHSTFNQFQTIDMSLTNSVQQYINYLGFIEQQIYTVSGVNQQRMGKIHQDEAVGNVQQTIQSSETITQYLFDSHQEVKRRVYESIIEVAKICYRNGMITQYVNDDLTIEMLNLEEFEFENSEFAVFVSNLDKDKLVKTKLDQLAQVAMEQQKVDLSQMIDIVLNDSPNEIINVLKRAEADFYQRQQDTAKQEQTHQQELVQAQQQHEQMLQAFEAEQAQLDRDTNVYISDSKNQTSIETTTISAMGFAKDTDVNENQIPDVMEINKLAFERQKHEADKFHNDLIETNKSKQHNDKIKLEKDKLGSKEMIEKLKIKQVAQQNASQELIQKRQEKLKEKEMNNKLQIERLKLKNKSKTK